MATKTIQNHPRLRAYQVMQARQSGHEIEVICHWMIEDDADFSTVCSCGWVGKHRCASGAHNLGRKHIEEIIRNG